MSAGYARSQRPPTTFRLLLFFLLLAVLSLNLWAGVSSGGVPLPGAPSDAHTRPGRPEDNRVLSTNDNSAKSDTSWRR
jgi:hypothetical protein